MSEEQGLLLGRVTAGLPALAPEARFAAHQRQLTRHRSRQALIDKLERETFAAESGGVGGHELSGCIGRPLTALQLEQRLKRCNPNLIVERSIADSTKSGVYRIEEGQKKFICGMESGFMPEFSVRHIETQRIPDPDIEGHWQEVPKFKGETRGWRTVLARLLRSGVIDPAAIEKWFEISKGRDNRNWQALTT